MLVPAGRAIRLDILAHSLGHPVVKADVTQVGDCHVREEAEHSGERGKRMADEPETQIVAVRPSLVLGELFHDRGRQTFAGKHIEQVAFG